MDFGKRRDTYRLPTDVLDDVGCVVDVHSVKVDACERARVGDAVEDRRHATTRTAPVRPKIDDGDAICVDLYSRGWGGNETNGRKRVASAAAAKKLTTLWNCVSEVSGTTVMIPSRWVKKTLV